MSQNTEFLLEHNRVKSEEFTSIDAQQERRAYRGKYPTAICALKCMDGRINLPIITDTPPGIIQPWRSLGGKFNLGRPHFGDLMLDWVNRSTNEGRSCLVLTTYHFSKSSEKLGCRGFDYNTGAAKHHTLELKQQFERIFGTKHQVVYPVQMGIETDEDALIVHGSNPENTLDLSQVTDITSLPKRIQDMFPDMRQPMLADFCRLLEGNLSHIAAVREIPRPAHAVDHGESVIAIGRGYDWLHLPNYALILGICEYNLTLSVQAAAGIVLSNLQEKRIDPTKGIVLMSSSPCWHEKGTPEWHQIVEKTNLLAIEALKVITESTPELLEYLEPLVGVVAMRSRIFIPQNFPLPSPLY